MGSFRVSAGNDRKKSMNTATGGPYWIRTSDLFRVKEARYLYANGPALRNFSKEIALLAIWTVTVTGNFVKGLLYRGFRAETVVNKRYGVLEGAHPGQNFASEGSHLLFVLDRFRNSDNVHCAQSATRMWLSW